MHCTTCTVVLNGLYKGFIVVDVVCVSNLNENQLTSFNITLLHLTSQLTTLYVDKSRFFFYAYWGYNSFFSGIVFPPLCCWGNVVN